MAFRVQEFRSQLVEDGARPNLFQCTLTFPGIATVSGASEKFTFMCRAASLPGRSNPAIPVNFFGRELKFAGQARFQDWTVTIINDEDFIVRNAFEKWLNGINSHAGNLRDPSLLQGDGGYQQDGRVVQYGKTGDVIKSYNFIGLFPVDLSPIDLAWDANDAIEEYAVTLSYQWWESDTTDATSSILSNTQ